ncbi:hypothetical protein CMV30_01565 [Nibricoccus aquaticus]|uniref:Organic solvent tolerance-like N-terminal domain-containing protein n=1 Tax=Nibricoccus aquaticus TaxID=2576891 RepID=A0A290QBR4_9BACT|nr:hypothetical protein [Nibricoccus aquaticus]ATC62758.1 hypothetical protein CMV30_01565 [Nibricoccus aquaticus]
MTRARHLPPSRLACARMFIPALALALSAVSAVQAQSASVIANAPVKNMRLPSFNDAGHRTSLLRAGEARYISNTHIDVLELNFAQFVGDGSTETVNLLLAPSATVTIPEKNRYLISGKESVRLIAKNAEATGEDWTYDYSAQRLIMNKNVRVVFHTELKGILD